MGRRIKEDPMIHRERIAQKAMHLFARQGIAKTKMDEIASLAGYSKATLYVYFKNKEDIVSFLALQSMTKLRDSIRNAAMNGKKSKDTFMAICDSLVTFQREYPDFFNISLGYIRLNQAEGGVWTGVVMDMGEEINRILFHFLKEGIERGELTGSDDYFETVFHMWGMISGMILLAKEKEAYILQRSGITKEEYLRRGFLKIYRILERQEDDG